MATKADKVALAAIEMVMEDMIMEPERFKNGVAKWRHLDGLYDFELVATAAAVENVHYDVLGDFEDKVAKIIMDALSV